MDVFYGIMRSIGEVFYYTWWFFLPIILFPLFESTWLFWRQEVFKHETNFILLELRMPREIKKSPMAMEQVLTAIHGLRNVASDVREKWWDGEVTRWYGLELVSFGGEAHFYIRTYAKQKPLIEAAFFSYYPDIEVVEVEDYTSRLPASVGEMYKSGYDLWGSELVLAKEAAYPIKSYLDFESPDEDKQYDPISVFLEVLGKIKREEMICIQILIAPAGAEWKDKYKNLVEELRSKKQKSKKASATLGIEFPHILPTFPVKSASENAKDDNTFMKSLMRTPGETDVLKAIEENLSKPAFKTLVRFLYFSPKELFQDTFPRRGVIGAFNQYGSLDMNSFVQNYDISTRTKVWQWPHLFPEARNTRRKQRVLAAYRHREIPPETAMGKLLLSKFLNWDHSERYYMSTRSLATIFHPPTFLVLTAPHLKRVESRKAGAPAGMAIYGDESELEKFN